MRGYIRGEAKRGGGHARDNITGLWKGHVDSELRPEKRERAGIGEKMPVQIKT